MLGERVSGFGKAVRRWRRRSHLSIQGFAKCLYDSGFDRWGDPARLAERIGVIEASDEWPFGQDAAKPFLEACVACLRHDSALAKFISWCLGALIMRRANLPESMLARPPAFSGGPDAEDDV